MSRNLANNPNDSAFDISIEEAAGNEALEPSPLSISKDGYVRLSRHELSKIVLKHLISGLDEDDLPDSGDGKPSTISGYTEWQSNTDPAISIGWDWCLKISQGKYQYALSGFPRSNVMLVDECNNKDLDPASTEKALEALIETTDWNPSVQKYISERYL